MGPEAWDGQEEMQRAAELVESSHVPPGKRVALLLGEVDVGKKTPRVVLEARAVRGILLQAVQNDVHVVATHATLHSSAARSMRPISPKKRTRAFAGITMPISTIQFSSSWDPVS